jgi:hypothetical protein
MEPTREELLALIKEGLAVFAEGGWTKESLQEALEEFPECEPQTWISKARRLIGED